MSAAAYTCLNCGKQYTTIESFCPECGVPNPSPAPGTNLGANATVRMLLPVGRSGWAIAAGYLGLFSVLFIPAPVALLISLLAIRDIRKHPEKHGMGRAIFGLIMGALFTLGLGFFLVASHR